MVWIIHWNRCLFLALPFVSFVCFVVYRIFPWFSERLHEPIRRMVGFGQGAGRVWSDSLTAILP
jgi:hypothetical protein